MPIFVRTKSPPMSLVSHGELDKKTMKKFRKEIGHFLTLQDYKQNKPMYLPTVQHSNIAYFTTITKEEFEVMEETTKNPDGRIVKPQFKGFRTPGKKRR